MPARCVALTHHRPDSAGLLPDIASALGLDLTVRTVEDGLPDVSDIDVAVVLGSPEAAYDDQLPWLAKELAWLREAVTASVPVLGICFGSQILARALGGTVRRNHTPEIGWTTVDTSDTELVARGPWLNFHFDAFTVPPGAIEIARTSLAPQAYFFGRCMGVQFHPEITEKMFRSWHDHWTRSPAGRTMLAGLGDLPDRMLAHLVEHAEVTEQACIELIERFLVRTAR